MLVLSHVPSPLSASISFEIFGPKNKKPTSQWFLAVGCKSRARIKILGSGAPHASGRTATARMATRHERDPLATIHHHENYPEIRELC
jgi:hypothetical protein